MEALEADCSVVKVEDGGILVVRVEGALLKDDLRKWIDSRMKGSERRG